MNQHNLLAITPCFRQTGSRGFSLTDIDILRECGTALYGERWRSSLAIDLSVSERTVRNWNDGDHPIPSDVLPRLLNLIEARRLTLDGIVERIRERIARGIS